MGDYQSAVKTAEEAVATMKDQKLKEIAFGQILAHLLSAGKPPAAGSKHSPAAPQAKHSATAKGKKPTGTLAWLTEMADSSFFKSPRHVKAILEELAGHSHHLRGSDLTWPLQHLCHEKILRRKKMPPAEGKAPVWHWSNWS